MSEVDILRRLQIADYTQFEDNLSMVSNLIYRDLLEYEYYNQVKKSEKLEQIVNTNLQSEIVEKRFLALIKQGYLEHAKNSDEVNVILHKLESLEDHISSHRSFLLTLCKILKWHCTERTENIDKFALKGRELLESLHRILKNISCEFEYLVLKIYELRILNKIGVAYFNHGRYDEAYVEYRKVIEYENAENISKIVLLNSVGNTAIIKFILDEYIEAREIFIHLIKLQREMGLRDHLAKSYQNLAAIMGFLEEIDEVIIYCKKSLEIKRELDMIEELPTTLITLSDALIKKNQINEALAYLNESVALASRYNNIQHQIGNFMQLGILEWRRGNYPVAIEYYQKALVIVKDNDMLRDMQSVYMNLGLIYVELNQLDRAQQYYEQALDILKENNFKIWQGKIYFNLFILHLRKGELEICRNMIQKMEELITIDVPEEDKAYRKQHMEIMKALLLKEENSAQAKFQAQSILQRLYQSNIKSVYQKVPVLLNLVELSILELRIVHNTDTIQLIEQVVEDLKFTAQTNYLHPLYVNSLILESKFKLINNDLQGALTILNAAEEYSNTYSLPKLQENIRVEKEHLEEEITKWTNLANQGKSMYHRIKETKIDELLSQLVTSYNQTV